MRAAGLALLMIGCGGAPKVQVDADYAARGGRAEVGETTAQPEEPPHGTRAPVRTPAPLPDGWPREPIEPLPLKKRHWTVMDAHDPIARLVRDFNEPGELRIELTTRKAKGFKATVQLHDSFGETLFEAVLRDRLTIGPRAIVPGTLYLLVRREGGLAELGIKTTYAAEHYDGIH